MGNQLFVATRLSWICRFTCCLLVVVGVGGTGIGGAGEAGAQTAAADPIALEAAIKSSVLQNAQLKRRTVERAANLINNVRNKLDACGNKGMLALNPPGLQTDQADGNESVPVPTRPTLRWNPLLDRAAQDHAMAMASEGFFRIAIGRVVLSAIALSVRAIGGASSVKTLQPANEPSTRPLVAGYCRRVIARSCWTIGSPSSVLPE